jgi:uncharacterized protein with PIN domain
MSKRLTTEQFIEKAKKVHGDKYSYDSKQNYGYRNKVIIDCPIHGKFTQTFGNHLNGRGCKKCSNKTLSEQKRSTTNEFILKAKKIHQDKYDYTNTRYITAKDFVDIICPIHGIFSQRAHSHLQGHGCPICCNEIVKMTNLSNTNVFIKKAKEIHGNIYSYEKVKYIHCNTPVKIICPIHGIFEQKPSVHLAGSKCKRCSKTITGIGYNEGKYFTPYIENIFPSIECQYPVLNYFVDFYIPELNLVIEYDEYYHKTQLEYDALREEKIKKELDCDIIRIDDKKFMENNTYADELFCHINIDIRKLMI